MVGVAAGGCAGSKWWPLSAWAPKRAPATEASASDLLDPTFLKSDRGSSVPLELVQLEFDVLRAEFPLEGVRHAAKLWNHVDELRYDTQLGALLARNGLRIGAAPAGAWPALRAVFTAGRARVQQTQQVVQAPAPLTIDLATLPEPQTIFTFDREGRMAGKTYPAGTKLVHLGYVVHPELDGCTDVSIALEIREPAVPGGWQPGEDLMADQPRGPSHVFPALNVVLTLRPEEFLLIGPSATGPQANEYVLGERFFTEARGGERFETVLCVAPRVFRPAANPRTGKGGRP